MGEMLITGSQAVVLAVTIERAAEIERQWKTLVAAVGQEIRATAKARDMPIGQVEIRVEAGPAGISVRWADGEVQGEAE